MKLAEGKIRISVYIKNFYLKNDNTRNSYLKKN